MREIILSTEVSGANFGAGEELIEIGAIELIDEIPTGKIYHQYINPDKEVDEIIFKMRGLSSDFLKDYPKFSQIADEFLEFIGDATFLIAHNAYCDIEILNRELKQANKQPIPDETFIDTFGLTTSLFPDTIDHLHALCLENVCEILNIEVADCAKNNLSAIYEGLNIKMPTNKSPIPEVLKKCQLISLLFPKLLKKMKHLHALCVESIHEIINKKVTDYSINNLSSICEWINTKTPENTDSIPEFLKKYQLVAQFNPEFLKEIAKKR